MKIQGSLEQQQSLSLSPDMKQAIDMLAMDAAEIDKLIDDELLKNPSLIEIELSDQPSPYDQALAMTAHSEDFRAFLLHQARESFNALEQIIAEALIYNLSDDGLLKDFDNLRVDLAEHLEVWPEWIDSVRFRLMKLDPLGCAARSIEESLMVQAQERFTNSTIALELKTRKFHDQRLKLLNPKPAQAYVSKSPDAGLRIELLVKKNDKSFNIEHVSRASHRLSVYGSLGKSADRARFFLKAIRFREHSLQLVASCIVEHQYKWFFNNEPLRPLTLKQIASACELHLSTVSRLVNNKYMSTERGVFELKYFFCSHVKNNSSQKIKLLIKNIFASENPYKPYSDQELCDLLKLQDIIISRRAISKYRESLGFLPAHQRRTLK